MTEEALRRAMDRLRSGERAAFEEIYQGLSTPVYTVLFRVTGERQGAEDLLQETFLKLYRQPPGEEVRTPLAAAPSCGDAYCRRALRRARYPYEPGRGRAGRAGGQSQA